MEKKICHDCKKELVKGDQVVRYQAFAHEDLFKCKDCYEKEPALKNFQACDVYSRVVGFHTPVRRWNEGKASEWKDRKTYRVNSPACACV